MTFQSSKPVVLIRASHPAPCVAVTALTALLAIAAGHGFLSGLLITAAVAVALLLCVVLSLACGLASAAVHLFLGVASGWGYNLYLKRTVWSAVPYALAFGILPAAATLALPDPELPAP